MIHYIVQKSASKCLQHMNLSNLRYLKFPSKSISTVSSRVSFSRHGANSATCCTKVDQRRPPLKSSATHAASALAATEVVNWSFPSFSKKWEDEEEELSVKNTHETSHKKKHAKRFSNRGRGTLLMPGKNFLRQTSSVRDNMVLRKRLARHGTWLWSSSNSLPMANPMTCLGPTMARNSFVQPDLTKFVQILGVPESLKLLSLPRLEPQVFSSSPFKQVTGVPTKTFTPRQRCQFALKIPRCFGFSFRIFRNSQLNRF